MMGLYEIGPSPVWGAVLMGWIGMLVVAVAVLAGIVLAARAAARRSPEAPAAAFPKRYAA